MIKTCLDSSNIEACESSFHLFNWGKLFSILASAGSKVKLGKENMETVLLHGLKALAKYYCYSINFYLNDVLLSFLEGKFVSSLSDREV